ncbi:MAG: NAD(+)/NADH kinase, partial [Clostridia bacterium]|nr:NAD(+)/NADH kinase [Clostridia bacterium]
NDIVLKGELARMINISLDIDGTNTNNYPADGVIIATATGSTAYSLSAGGAIVHPELDAIMITPICPHTLKARCMIVPDSKTVQVSFSEPYRNNAVLNVDGKRNFVLSEDACVKVKKSKYKVKFINLNKRNFYDIIREKIADRTI